MRAPIAFVLAIHGAVGCRTPAEPPADFAEQLAAFREAHEAEIAGPHGPLSVVAAFYVQPGQRLSLAVEDGRAIDTMTPVGEPMPESAALSLRVDDDGIECTRGCEPGPVAIDAARTVERSPLAFGIGPQPGAEGRDGLRVLVHDPAAPARARGAIAWAAPAERWWTAAKLRPTPDAEPEPLATTRGLVKPMRPVGTLEMTLPGGEAVALVAYDAGPGELLVPFSDASNGASTYDVGRYLTVERPADDAAAVVVDFNRATNPWCAYSEHYNCPIPPAANRIHVAVDAGEQRYH